MTPRDIFLNSIYRKPTPRYATGSPTSVVTLDLMDKIGVHFPEAHLDAEKMATLAAAGHTILGFDNVMPLFSVWHESAAIGCNVKWGERDKMPDCGEHLCNSTDEDPQIPSDFLSHPGCSVPLEAIGLLKKRLGDEVAVVGKVFGPWTLGYHVYGVENFLMVTLLDVNRTRTIMDELKEITVQFAKAQIDAGADALCLADHATRDLCSPGSYRDFLKDMHQELAERIDCPLLLHICGDTSDRIGYISQTDIAAFHYDSKVPTCDVRKLAGDKLGLAGGTSNYDIVLNGNEESIIKDVQEKIAAGVDIIGPECAVPLNAPYSNLKLIADTAKQFVSKASEGKDM